MSSTTLDRIDRHLLALLQGNNRRSLRSLADELDISAPTCLRRMRRLESLGVIKAHVSLLDPKQIGLSVMAYVEVTLVNPSGVEMTTFERRMQKCPEVIQCSEVAGVVDYLVVVVAADMEAFGAFARKQFADDNRIASYTSLIVLRQTKNEHALPILA